MKKTLLILSILLLSINCSKSDPKSENEPDMNQEIDVSEGQTNWTKYAFFDTIPKLEAVGSLGIYDIDIRGNKIVMGGYFGAPENSSRVWESEDQGLTWKETLKGRCGAGNKIIDVAIPSKNIIYALGNCLGNSILFKSVDGEWSSIYLDQYAYNVAGPMHFFDDNVGIIGNIKTIDGGITWSTIEDLKGYPNFDYSNGAVISISFVDNSIGYASSNKEVFKTTNSGENWSLIYQNNTGEYKSVYFLDADTGFLMTEFNLLKTLDGGATWKSVLPNKVRDISFVTNEIGFVTSSKGIYKTVDKGESWKFNYTSAFYIFEFRSSAEETDIYAPAVLEFESENLGITAGILKYNLSDLPNGKGYVARTTTLGE